MKLSYKCCEQGMEGRVGVDGGEKEREIKVGEQGCTGRTFNLRLAISVEQRLLLFRNRCHDKVEAS